MKMRVRYFIYQINETDFVSYLTNFTGTRCQDNSDVSHGVLLTDKGCPDFPSVACIVTSSAPAGTGL